MNTVQIASYQDSITIISSADRNPAKLTKVFGPGEAVISPAGRGTFFRVIERGLDGLADLHSLLVELALLLTMAVLRDRLNPGLSLDVPHRRNRKTFALVAHHWVMLDFDGIEAPPGMSPTDPKTIEWLIRNHLPPEFCGASYIIQFSSSAGTAKAGRKIKVHLWFCLSIPARSDALLAWAKSYAADPAVFRLLQIHYTANPIHQGCANPLPGRRILFVQKAQEAVPLVLQDTPRSHFAVPTAAPTADPVQDSAGKLTDGREAWLLAWNHAYVRVNWPLDLAAMTAAACAAFYAECSTEGGTWPSERIAEKVRSTVERAERGDIPGLPRRSLQPHWKLFPEPIEDIRAALAQHVAEFFSG